MNIERLELLAKAVEGETHARLNMSHWFAERDREWEPRAWDDHPCGTVACIGGTADLLFGDKSPYDMTTAETAANLGLTDEQADTLFFDYGSAPRVVSPADAARVIRHLIATGEVNWSILEDGVMLWQMHNDASRDLLGFIPQFLSDSDPRPAAKQFNEAYAHGGGWHSFGKGKWKLQLADSTQSGRYGASRLAYPGDPAFRLIAHTILHKGTPEAELVMVFEHGPWVVVKQLDSDEFDVSRMD